MTEETSPFEPLDPARFPRQLVVDLPPDVAEWLARQVALTGRSPNELLVALLDQGLQRLHGSEEAPMP